jgi:hypothetical protein
MRMCPYWLEPHQIQESLVFVNSPTDGGMYTVGVSASCRMLGTEAKRTVAKP